jgi:hypothetical protein
VSRVVSEVLDDLSFLLGRWIGDRAGDRVEEIWTRAASDAMVGVFCWSRGDGSRSYELLVAESRPTGVTLTVHAFPTGERAKAPQRYIARISGGEQVVFAGREDGVAVRVIYRRERAGRLYAALERDEDGRRRIYPWHYRAAPLGPTGAALESA